MLSGELQERVLIVPAKNIAGSSKTTTRRSHNTHALHMTIASLTMNLKMLAREYLYIEALVRKLTLMIGKYICAFKMRVASGELGEDTARPPEFNSTHIRYTVLASPSPI